MPSCEACRAWPVTLAVGARVLRHRFSLRLAGFVVMLATASAAPLQAAESLAIGPTVEGGLVLSGPDARQQLFVTTLTPDGREHDATRQAVFSVAPPEIVTVDTTGLVQPTQDGTATITASTASGMTATIAVTVEGIASPPPVSFQNQIVPIFTKLGCNGGGCHGKSGGQNGFQLSLLGFHPEDDYEYIVKESRGRRVFPAAPERSLLIEKAVGRVPHGGGKRLEPNDEEYRLLVRWVEQGLRFGSEQDPVVASIECQPSGRVLDRGKEQQIVVLAHYSDGSVVDVTRSALYEANITEMAECSADGLVRTRDLAGEVAVMARYQGHVATFRATIPLGPQIAAMPESANLVDEAVFAKLKLLGIPPSEPCDDATFLRRVSLDVTGILPTADEARGFLADNDPQKRERLVERLLDSPGYADLFANKWNMILRNRRRSETDKAGTYAFHRWIWQSLYENKPYDEFVREILTASGAVSFNPPVVWYREVDTVEEQVEDAGQLFLGLRLQCARCHHHPFEKWSQDDYYGMAAFFSRVGRKGLTESAATVAAPRDQRIFHNSGRAFARNPRTGKELPPTGLGTGAIEVAADEDPRVALADWMTDPANPFFAKSVVNRYWKHFFGRGLVDPEDDMRATNPPSNPELLASLSRQFIDSGYDLKALVRTITLSKTYQLSSEPNALNSEDRQNFSRFAPKRLTAEILFDALHQVTATSESYAGHPAGTRAIQLSDPSVGPYFLKVFGQPQADTACECERSQEANLAQSLHLLNSGGVQDKISHDSGRAAQLAADERPHEEKVSELYLWVYGRPPTLEELQVATAHIAGKQEGPRPAYEDLVWALINTKEFLFNH